MFPLLQNKKYGYIFSSVLIFLSLVFLIMPQTQLRFGIDFTGGTELILSFEDTIPSSDQVITAYDTAFGVDVKVPKTTAIQGENEILVRSHILSSSEVETIKSTFDNQGFIATVQGVSTVGASMGDYFKSQAIWVVLTALTALIAFVAWAFRKVPAGIPSWKFGGAAIIALIHDVLIIMGVFAVLGQFISLEVDTMFVTAILTVLGFSVHDTIVVFDRIRENLQGKKSSLLGEIAEASLWQTMGRSVHTSVSTLFVLVSMLIWGAPSIFAFVFAIACGIVIGTYSSIFIATPILVDWAKSSIAEFTEEEKAQELLEKTS